MNFYFVNNNGGRINFYGSPYILAEHDLLDWTLAYTTVNNRSINFRTKPAEKSFTVRLMPKAVTRETRKVLFEALYDAFVDVVSVPGRLYADTGAYVECRIITSRKAEWNLERNVNISCTVLIDHPKWQKPTTYELGRESESEDTEVYEYLDYDYGYPYDFKGTLPASTTITNDGTEAADYEITMYGPASNPLVTINGAVIGANVTLGRDEKLVISSRNNTVIKYTRGVPRNMFNNRIKGARSMFEKLATGDLIVLWSGTFQLDITVLAERLEPEWN